jgi:hypothetical protein
MYDLTADGSRAVIVDIQSAKVVEFAPSQGAGTGTTGLWTITDLEMSAWGSQPAAISGDVIVLGQRFCVTTNVRPIISARVFRRHGSAWEPEQNLLSDSSVQGSCFGGSVAVDGNRIVVGSGVRREVENRCYARTFVHSSTTGLWELEQQFEHPARQFTWATEGFATGLALRGNHLVIGSPYDDFDSLDSGALYAYRFVNGRWLSQGSIAGVAGDIDTLGWKVALLDDGIVATGSGFNGPEGGIVYSLCAAGLGDHPIRGQCLPGISGLFRFIDLFLTGSPDADFNADNTVTVEDLFRFIAAWSAGCNG